MKYIELAYLPDDEVWVRGQNRPCIVENVTVGKDHRGEPEITYTWYNLDCGVDCTEVWDDGWFVHDDIGKTVFNSLEELMKAFPEDFEYPDFDEV